jgi:hypothetical protein
MDSHLSIILDTMMDLCIILILNVCYSRQLTYVQTGRHIKLDRLLSKHIKTTKASWVKTREIS